MRDGLVRLLGLGASADSLTLAHHVVVTAAIVLLVAIIGTVCTKVEIVLAYKVRFEIFIILSVFLFLVHLLVSFLLLLLES